MKKIVSFLLTLSFLFSIFGNVYARNNDISAQGKHIGFNEKELNCSTALKIAKLNKSKKSNYIVCFANNESDNTFRSIKRSNKSLELISDINNCYSIDAYGRDIIDMASNPKIKTIEPDVCVTANSLDTEEFSWNSQFIEANDDYSEIIKDEVKIAIIDSGVSPNLGLNIYEHIDFTNEENPIPYINDNTGHGTGVAGVINSQPESGLRGINPKAKLYSVKVLDKNNSAPISRIISAIDWCIDNGINIINMSFGMNNDSPLLHQVINEAYNHNIIMIASAGNSGNIQYPANYDEVISVGSVDSNGDKSDFSANAELMAPGEKIISEGYFSGYTALTGTSFSAPHVTGVASVLLGIDSSKSVDFIRQLLKSCSVYNTDYGLDIVNLQNCIDNYYEFSQDYLPGVEINYHKEIDVNFDTSQIVVGSWSGNNHIQLTNGTIAESLITGLIDPTSGDNAADCYELLVECSKLSDSNVDRTYNGTAVNFKETLGLHGWNNYVANLNFLYTVAYNYINRDSFSDGDNRIEHPVASVSTNNVSSGVRNAVLCLLNTSVIDGVAESSELKKALKVLGFALHLAGDIHAHRTRVPTTSLNNNNPTVANRITKSYFADHDDCVYAEEITGLKEAVKTSSTLPNKYKCYQCLSTTINNHWMEFRDLKYFAENLDSVEEEKRIKKLINNTYTDNINCYSSRFNHGSSLLVKILASNLLKKNTFNAKWMFHDCYNQYDNNYNYTIVLNNLVNYALTVNPNLSVTDQMRAHSTSQYI